MLERFKIRSIAKILKRGATGQEAKVAEAEHSYNEAKESFAHRISVKNSPCKCGHASSQHRALNACSAKRCDCQHFVTDEEKLEAMIEKKERKKLPAGEQIILFLDGFTAEAKEESPAERRMRIQNELRGYPEYQGVRRDVFDDGFRFW